VGGGALFKPWYLVVIRLSVSKNHRRRGVIQAVVHGGGAQFPPRYSGQAKVLGDGAYFPPRYSGQAVVLGLK